MLPKLALVLFSGLRTFAKSPINLTPATTSRVSQLLSKPNLAIASESPTNPSVF